MANLPETYEEAVALAEIVAKEINAAYTAYKNRPENHMFYVKSATLKGLPVAELEAVKFAQILVRRLQESGIAAYPTEVNGAYSEGVQVQSYVEGNNN